MAANDIFVWAVALLIYSGPFVPLLAPLMFRRASHSRFRRNVRALFILTSVHGFSFLPYIIAVVTDTPDALHRLSLSFFVGAVMFIGALAYAVPECFRLRSLMRSRDDA